MTPIEQNCNIIVLGTENGIIKDYDIQSRCVIRRAVSMHDGSKITSLVHCGKYLASASENGMVVIYDYLNQ